MSRGVESKALRVCSENSTRKVISVPQAPVGIRKVTERSVTVLGERGVFVRGVTGTALQRL